MRSSHVTKLNKQYEEDYFKKLFNELEELEDQRAELSMESSNLSCGIQTFENSIKKNRKDLEINNLDSKASLSIEDNIKHLSTLLLDEKIKLIKKEEEIDILNKKIKSLKLKNKIPNSRYAKTKNIFVNLTETQKSESNEFNSIQVNLPDMKESLLQSQNTEHNLSIHQRKTIRLVSLIPIVGIFATLSELALGVYELSKNDHKLFEMIPLTVDAGKVLTGTIPLMYAVLLVNEDLEHAISGIELGLKIIKTRQLPNDTEEDKNEWPRISKNHETIAIVISASCIGFVTFIGGFSAYFFMSMMPKVYNFSSSINLTAWEVFAFLMSIIRGKEIFLKEGKQVYSCIRKWFPLLEINEIDQKNSDNKIVSISKLLSALPVTAEVLSKAIEDYLAFLIVCGIKKENENKVEKYLLFIPCLIFVGTTDLIISGKMTINAFQAFINKIQKGFNGKDALAFLITMAFSIGVAESMRQVFLTMMAEPEVELPLSLPEQLVSATGALTAVKFAATSAYHSYSFFRNFPEKLSTGFQHLKSSFGNLGNRITSSFSCCRNRNYSSESVPNSMNSKPVLNSFASRSLPNSPHRLFKPVPQYGSINSLTPNADNSRVPFGFPK